MAEADLRGQLAALRLFVPHGDTEADWETWARLAREYLHAAGLPPDGELAKGVADAVTLDRHFHSTAETIVARAGQAHRIIDRLQRELDRNDEEGPLAVEEHRNIEAVISRARTLVESGQLEPETEAMVIAATATLQAQLTAPKPHRGIIGRALRSLITHGGALALGVSGNYLTDLAKAFGLPWPGK